MGTAACSISGGGEVLLHEGVGGAVVQQWGVVGEIAGGDAQRFGGRQGGARGEGVIWWQGRGDDLVFE